MSSRLHQTEAQFQQAVLDAARVHQWFAHHQRPARVRRDGADTYRSAIAGDKGFPDIVLVRSRNGVGRLIVAELKSATGKLTAEQAAWLGMLELVPGIEVFCWVPDDMDAILEILR